MGSTYLFLFFRGLGCLVAQISEKTLNFGLQTNKVILEYGELNWTNCIFHYFMAIIKSGSVMLF